MSDVFRYSVVVIILSILVLILLGGVGGSTTGTTSQRVAETVALNGTGNFVDLGSATGTNETIRNSRGFAVATSDAPNSQVSSNSGIDLAREEFTICTFTRVGATSSGTILSADGRVLLGYDSDTNEWTLWYYDDGSTDSYELRATASSPSTGYSQICAWYDDSLEQLRLYENATRVASVSTNGPNSASLPKTGSIEGALEETRVFAEPLNSSERNQTVSQPIEPLETANRTARIYYDVNGTSSEPIWFASADATVQNASYVDGFDGDVLSSGGLLGSGDYSWNSSGPRLRPEAGGKLEGAPVAFADFNKTTSGGSGSGLPWAVFVSLMLVLVALTAMGREIQEKL